VVKPVNARGGSIPAPTGRTGVSPKNLLIVRPLDRDCVSVNSGNARALSFFANSNNYPGFQYDNIGRFWYVELKKKF
jgi:hypothetical protein